MPEDKPDKSTQQPEKDRTTPREFGRQIVYKLRGKDNDFIQGLNAFDKVYSKGADSVEDQSLVYPRTEIRGFDFVGEQSIENELARLRPMVHELLMEASQTHLRIAHNRQEVEHLRTETRVILERIRAASSDELG
jgi:hypothetical protein